MQLRDGHLWLSPSDLSAYLACPHLTTLELESARGERNRPHTRDELAELVAEKGDLHEERVPRAPAPGGPRRRRDRASGRSAGSSAAAEATVARDARRRGGDLPGDLLARRLARAGRLPHPRRRAVRPRRVELRAVRHEARALARSRRPCSSSPGTRQEIAAIQGRLPERLHVVLGTSEVETYRPADVDAYLRDRAAAACGRTSRSGPRPTRGPATTARAATSSPSAASAGRTTTT